MTETIAKLPVLVVEDSPFSRKLLEYALSGDSYSLLIAENGKEALQLFKEHRPAMVITDWMLPDSSGPEHVDLDGFNDMNDSHGHEAGDQFLRGVARILKEHTRASDLSGRMGGDEFLLVMTHVEKANIPMTVERLREKIASLKFSFGSESISVTASFGICGFQGKEPPEFSVLVRQADNALYGAKRGGRNQVKIESYGVLVP